MFIHGVQSDTDTFSSSIFEDEKDDFFYLFLKIGRYLYYTPTVFKKEIN